MTNDTEALDLAQLQKVSQGYSDTRLNRAALEAAGPRQGDDCLDLGCGGGELLEMLLRDGAHGELFGVDVVDYLDEEGRGYLRDRVHFFFERAETVLPTLPSFDVITMVEVYEHLERPLETVRLVARKLRPGGRTVITSPNIASLRNALELMVRGQLNSFRPSNPSHLVPLITHVVERVLAGAGLQTTVRYTVGDSLPGGYGRWPETLTRRPWTAAWAGQSVMIVGFKPERPTRFSRTAA
jgi:2-polyprenyl-3-methyl-5-hydroxy-6-metoxy-1,4-benzoquinol methylase